MPTQNDDMKTKLDYARGFLKAEPTMSDADLNYYLDKKKLSPLSGPQILALREELGFTVVGKGRGRKVVPKGETEGAPAPTVQTAPTTQPKPVQAPPPAALPPATTPSAPQAVRTPPVQAQSEAEKSADDHLMADLVSRLQQIMEREGIVYLEIPRRGQVKIHENKVVTRTLTPTAPEAGAAAAH